MTYLKGKTAWYHVLRLLATCSFAVALASVQAPCNGPWYQPVVPKQLIQEG